MTRTSRFIPGPLRTLLLLVTLTAVTGCNGFTDDRRTVEMDAQYEGLVGKRVAVLVSADDQTLFKHPDAPAQVGRTVAARLKTDVEGIQVVDPAQIAAFQEKNPYWHTRPYGGLLRDLDVQRLVYVDVSKYGTHEPGNRHVWRGEIIAGIGVAEADAPDPNNFVYFNTVRAAFPPGRPLGVLQSDDETIELGMLSQFSLIVSRLFHDHEVVR